MPKVILKGHITVPDDDLEAVAAALQTHIDLTRKEVGCLEFSVTPHPHAPNTFSVYEEFVDRSAYELHQARASTSAWGAVSANVKRDYNIYELD